jgi:hypothetical protein
MAHVAWGRPVPDGSLELLARQALVGRTLTGDIVVRWENFTIYAPLGTMIFVSVVLTQILNLIIRLRS